MTGRRVLVAALWLACALQAGAAQAWRGAVTRVSDGDTLWVRPAAGGKPVKVRIAGVDAPEICRAGGRAARKALAARVLGRQIELLARGQDDYGRTIAALALDGEDIAAWMVSQGHAWSYGFGRDGGPYAAQQRQAQAASRGLFADHAALAPRLFRKRHGPCDPAGAGSQSSRVGVLHGIAFALTGGNGQQNYSEFTPAIPAGFIQRKHHEQASS
jgi:endonuclease YncB( thermonuclease family)